MLLTLDGTYRRSRQELRRQLEPAAAALHPVIDVSELFDADAALVAELIMLNDWRRHRGLPVLTLVAQRPSDAVWTIFDICGVAMDCRFCARGR